MYVLGVVSAHSRSFVAPWQQISTCKAARYIGIPGLANVLRSSGKMVVFSGQGKYERCKVRDLEGTD